MRLRPPEIRHHAVAAVLPDMAAVALDARDHLIEVVVEVIERVLLDVAGQGAELVNFDDEKRTQVGERKAG